MTAPTKPTTREELLELAALDAVGLLDEYETDVYTRSFHHAPESVQREIRDLQAELVSDQSLLPTVQPPDELRRLVLANVARAVEYDSDKHAPIATIGRGKHGGRRGSVDRHAERRLGGPVINVWRAASFVLAGALIVVAYFFADAYEYGKNVSQIALDNATATELGVITGEPTFLQFMENPNCRKVVLRPADGSFTGTAMLHIDEERQKAFLLLLGMEDPDAQYTLTAKTSADEDVTVRKFNARNSVSGIVLDLTPKVLAAAVWTIADSAGNVLLSSSAIA